LSIAADMNVKLVITGVKVQAIVPARLEEEPLLGRGRRLGLLTGVRLLCGCRNLGTKEPRGGQGTRQGRGRVESWGIDRDDRLGGAAGIPQLSTRPRPCRVP